MPASTQYRYTVQQCPSPPRRLAQRIFAWQYARYRQPVEYGRRRQLLLDGLAGDVLEIGPGTGANLEHLAPAVRWIGLEPNEFMHERLCRAAAERGIEVRLLRGTVDAIPMPDQSVDAVVGTLVLCSVADQGRALAEVRRVLRPGGMYVFLEHVAAPAGTAVRRVQDVLAPLSHRCRGGCRPNRETWLAIEQAGFAETAYERFELAAPLGLRSPHIAGRAVR